jgi:hypothetical protein
MRLLLMLETAAEQARARYGATRLVVDRTVHDDSADIKALLADSDADSDLVDLWDLDPLLWDDANWAAMRYLPPGHVSIVHPLKTP